MPPEAVLVYGSWAGKDFSTKPKSARLITDHYKISNMATVLVRHKVNDYAKWKAVLDETKPMAKSYGVRSQRILRNFADPNEVVVVNEFDDMKAAQKFAKSDELKKVMERAGVAEVPSVWFLNEADKFTL